jgi:hypothetical protein
VSQDALDFVRNDPRVKALPWVEKMVLSKLAELHRLEVNCAFADNRYLAEVCLVGGKDPLRTVRGILERLEAKGLILRHATVRSKGYGRGSQIGNEIELPFVQAAEVTEAMRQQVFKVQRTRVAVQMELIPADGTLKVKKTKKQATGSTDGGFYSAGVGSGDTNRGESSAVDAADGTNGSLDSAVDVLRAALTLGNAVETVVEIGENLPPPPEALSPPPPETKGSSLDDVLDDLGMSNTPLPLSCSPDCGKAKAPINASTEARATASAKAKATTSATAEMSFGAGDAGEAGMSLGAELVGLDGIDAALVIEAESVLRGCGIAQGSTTRRQRKAVMDALVMYSDGMDVSLGEAGDHAVMQRRMYLGRAEGMIHKVDVRRFFAEGIWLQDWTSPAYEPRGNRRGGFDATVGMRRPN